MSMYSLVFIAATGLAAAGLASSLWATLTGEPPRVAALQDLDVLMPVRVLALVLSLPFLLGGVARYCLRENRHGVFFGSLALGGAACWCFVQGVVIVAGIMRLAAVAG